jgi:ketosteroid isomerase-like protein
MSQENIEIMRAAFEAWNTQDWDTFRDLHDPDIIQRSPPGWPEPGPFVGREAVMRQFKQLREAWDADAIEPISDYIAVADRVVVRYIWRGTGRGPESNMELTNVYTMRNGKIFYQEHFWDHAEALKVVGLSEDGKERSNG